jgi:hypothetical protein
VSLTILYKANISAKSIKTGLTAQKSTAKLDKLDAIGVYQQGIKK